MTMSNALDDRVQQMCAIWSEVLGITVTAEDDFFALGGDSLSAVEIQVRAEERLGLDVEFQDFFTASTPPLLLAAGRAIPAVGDRAVG